MFPLTFVLLFFLRRGFPPGASVRKIFISRYGHTALNTIIFFRIARRCRQRCPSAVNSELLCYVVLFCWVNKVLDKKMLYRMLLLKQKWRNKIYGQQNSIYFIVINNGTEWKIAEPSLLCLSRHLVITLCLCFWGASVGRNVLHLIVLKQNKRKKVFFFLLKKISKPRRVKWFSKWNFQHHKTRYFTVSIRDWYINTLSWILWNTVKSLQIIFFM